MWVTIFMQHLFVVQLVTCAAPYVCWHYLLPLTILAHTVQCFLLNVQLPQFTHLAMSLSIDPTIDAWRAA
jgi:hypothetical protein